MFYYHKSYSIKPGSIYEFKTHLTNHYLRISSGKILSKVVNATRTNTNHIHTFQFYKY